LRGPLLRPLGDGKGGYVVIARFSSLHALAAVALISTAPALAQKPLGKDPVPSILVWTPKQQLERYPAIEKTYAVGTIKKGANVRELPPGAPIDPKVTVGGKTSGIDDFMKQWRISGVIVVKDGKVVLEKYGMGRTPGQRWTSFSVAKSVTSQPSDRWVTPPNRRDC
jgi:hypothetical protein